MRSIEKINNKFIKMKKLEIQFYYDPILGLRFFEIQEIDLIEQQIDAFKQLNDSMMALVESIKKVGVSLLDISKNFKK